jgi:hypothetical protein
MHSSGIKIVTPSSLIEIFIPQDGKTLFQPTLTLKSSGVSVDSSHRVALENFLLSPY